MTKQSRNQRHWQAHVKALCQSGLNRAEYCRQHKLSYHALTYWHRKLSKPSSRATTLVPVPLRHSIRQNPGQAGQATLKVILPGMIAIEVSDNFSLAALTRLLTTLESR
jgi:transposase-like protein